MIKVYLFGGFRIEDPEGNEIVINAEKARCLFAYLAVEKMRAVERIALIDAIWPFDPDEEGSPEKRAERSLTNGIYDVNKAFAEAGVEGKVLVSKQKRVSIARPEEFRVDVDQFRELDLQLKQSESSKIHSLIVQFLDLYKGPLYEFSEGYDFYEYQSGFENIFLQRVGRAIEQLDADKDYEHAIPLARRYIEISPLDVEMHTRLIEFHIAQGDERAALHVIERYKARAQEQNSTIHADIERWDYQIQQGVITTGDAEVQEAVQGRVRRARGLRLPYVDRDEETARFKVSLDRALQREGSVLMVSGDPGIGKSTFCRTCLNYAQLHETLYLEAQCSETAENTPYHPFVDAIKRGLSASTDLLPGERKITKFMLEQVPKRSLRVMLSLIPQIQDIFPDLEPSPKLDDHDEEQRRMKEELCNFFLSLADSRLVILMLDDLHWSNKTTCDAFEELANKITSNQFIILGNYRENEIDASHPLVKTMDMLKRHQRLDHLRLGALSERYINDLVMKEIQETEQQRLSKRIYDESKGVPFFAVERLRSLFEAGIIYWKEENDEWGVVEDELDKQPVPDAITSIIRERFERLGFRERELLKTLAVIGRNVQSDFLRTIWSGDEFELVQSLDILSNRHFVKFNDGEFSLDHDFTREVAYMLIEPASREFMHRRVAQALEDYYAGFEESEADWLYGDLAKHFDLANSRKEALKYYLKAGEHVWKKNYAASEAVQYFDHALELAEKIKSTEGMMLACKGLGDVYVKTNQQQLGKEYCERALVMCDSREYRAEIFLSLANYHQNQRQLDEALIRCEEGIHQLRAGLMSPIAAALYYRAGTIQFWLGNYEESLNSYNSVLEILEENPDEVLKCNTLSGMAISLVQIGSVEESRKLLSAAKEMAIKLDDPILIGLSLFRQGQELYLQQRFSEAEDAWIESLAQLKRLESRDNELGTTYTYLMYARVCIADYQTAYSYALEGLNCFKRTDNSKSISNALGMLGFLAELLGNTSASRAFFEEAEVTFPDNDMKLYSLVLLNLLTDRFDEAIAWFEPNVDLFFDRQISLLMEYPNFSKAIKQFQSSERVKRLIASKKSKV